MTKDNTYTGSQMPEDDEKQIEEGIVFVEKDLTPQERDSLKDFLLKSREKTRSIIAIRLVWLLGITVFSTIVLSAIIILVPSGNASERESKYNFSKDIFSILLSTQTGLIGAALGFYFGSKEDG
ncbi:MAG: hypothetical protein ACHWZW_09910 [Spirulina sp.]